MSAPEASLEIEESGQNDSQHGDTTEEEGDEPTDPLVSGIEIEETQMDDGESTLKCYLVGIELYNFKSYHGHHIIGPFTELTGIIGPNGSGKSNLMDAISFALCIKQNAKIRVNKLLNLVNKQSHQSSTDSPPSDMDLTWKAYVKLIFKTANGKIQNLTRAILQDGKSRFRIDDKEQNREEYMKILNRMGIDAKNKIFLLFQGTVDALVTKNPKDFTRYMEEICGSIKDANDYDTLKDKIADKERKIKLLNDEKRDLASKKKVLERILTDRNRSTSITEEITQLKIKIILFKLHEQKNKIENIQQRLDAETDTLEKINHKDASLQQAKENIIEQFKTINKRLTSIEQRYRSSDLSITQKKHKVDAAKQKVLQLQKKLKSAELNKENSEKKRRSNEERIEISNLEAKIKEKEAEIEKLKSDPPKWMNQYNSLKAKYMDRLQREDLYDIYNNNQPFEEELNMLKKRLALTQEMKLSYEKEISNEEKCQNLDEMIEMKKKVLDRLTLERDSKEIEFQQKDAELLELKNEINRLREVIRHKYANIKRTKKEREENEFLRKLKKAYPGKVYGRVNSFFKVSHDKYKKATGIVLNKNSRTIVVDSLATIQQIARNEGKSFNYFSQTFIALDRVKADRDMKQLRNILLNNQKEICILADAIELIESHCSEPELKKLIPHLFGNIVWCPNEESACKVAYELVDGKKHDAISEDGTFYHSHGGISAELDDDVSITHELKDQEEKLYEKLKKLEEEYLKESENLRNEKNKLGPQDDEITRLSALINILKKQKEDLEEKKNDKNLQEEHKTKLSEFDSIIAKLQSAIDKKEKEFTRTEQLVAIEEDVFGDFFKQFDQLNIQTLKDFEAASQTQLTNVQAMDELEKQLEKMREELKILELNNWAENSHNWDIEIDSYQEKLDEAKKSYAEILKANEEEINDFQKLQEAYEKGKVDKERAQVEWQKIIVALEELINDRNSVENIINSLNLELIQCRRLRHELLNSAYMDSLPLPIKNRDNRQERISFSQLYDNQLPEEGAFTNEDEIEIQFKPIQKLLKDDEQENERTLYTLEEQLVTKQSELPLVTVTSTEQNLNKNLTDLRKKIASNNKELNKTHGKLLKIKEDFEKVKQERRRVFGSFFDKVNDNLNAFYQELNKTNSAQAFLIAENSEEPYLGGIQYSCIVPDKTFQPITALSGGEKCLAAFAFIYSCYSDRFPCFFILDEIDGSLDIDNIAKLMDFIKERTGDTQFILISHKSELFGRTDSLIGVCRETIETSLSGEIDIIKSQTFSLDLREFMD